VIAVHAGVEDTDPHAATVDTQVIPNTRGADCNHAGRDADAVSVLVLAYFLVALDRLDELDHQVGFDTFHIGADGQLTNGVHGSHDNHRVHEPVGGITKDAAVGLVVLEAGQKIDLRSIGTFLQRLQDGAVPDIEICFGVVKFQVQALNIGLLAHNDQDLDRVITLEVRQLALQSRGHETGLG